MKILKDYTLVSDAQCPICVAYSKTIVKSGILDQNARETYQEISSEACIYIDKNKTRHELALIDRKNGIVYYGIDGVSKLMTTQYPFLKFLFAFTPFYWMIRKTYFFLSYNRKVITPVKKNEDSCVPDLHIQYRIAYLLFTWIVSSLVLTNYSGLLNGVIPATKFYREFIICGGQIIFQGMVIRFLAKDKVWDYLGNMMTISFAASLVLLLFMSIGKLFSIAHPFIYGAFFMLVVAAMFAEHLRRMKLLGISLFASISWVIYRIIVLIIIFSGL
jgi:hypothetical protein